MSTTIVSGVWKITRWASVGRAEVRIAAPRTTPTAIAATIRTSRQPTARAWSATIGLARDTDRRDQDLACERSPAPREQPALRAVEGDGEVGLDDGVRRVARGQVDGRRGVDGDDGHLRAPRSEDELDRRTDRVAELAVDPGPEEGVDDDRSSIDVLREYLQVEPGRGVDAGDTRRTIETVPVSRR